MYHLSMYVTLLMCLMPPTPQNIFLLYVFPMFPPKNVVLPYVCPLDIQSKCPPSSVVPQSIPTSVFLPAT